MLVAATQWPTTMPDNPRGWLIRVAARRLTDQIRSETTCARSWSSASCRLYFVCCHPALSPASRAALTLRAVGGLTTAEIVRAFFVPEATMAQRLGRAKQTIHDAGLIEVTSREAIRVTRLLARLSPSRRCWADAAHRRAARGANRPERRAGPSPRRIARAGIAR